MKGSLTYSITLGVRYTPLPITTTSFRNNTVIWDTVKNVWKVFSLKEMQLPEEEQKVRIALYTAQLRSLLQSVKQPSTLMIDDDDD
jgi:hypothetical protein